MICLSEALKRSKFNACKQTAIERMERMLAHMKEEQTRMEARLAATKKFYARLTPEQRKVFDEELSPSSRPSHGVGPGNRPESMHRPDGSPAR
jgi:Spy/CpxP family protein refolding chaperone